MHGKKIPYTKPAQWNGGISQSAYPHLWNGLRVAVPLLGDEAAYLRTSPSSADIQAIYSERFNGGHLTYPGVAADVGSVEFAMGPRGLELTSSVAFFLSATRGGLWGVGTNLTACSFMWAGRWTANSADKTLCVFNNGVGSQWSTGFTFHLDEAVSGRSETNALRLRFHSQKDYCIDDFENKYDGQDVVLVATTESGSVPAKMYVNGGQVALTTIYDVPFNYSLGTSETFLDCVHLNAGQGGSDAPNTNGVTHCAAMWNRALSAEEVQEIGQDPWAPFRTKREVYRTYSLPAAGGTTFNESLTYTLTGSLTLGDVLEVSEPLSLSASGGLSAAASFEAHEALALSGTGSLIVSNLLEAAETLALSSSAAFGISSNVEVNEGMALSATGIFTLTNNVEMGNTVTLSSTAALTASVIQEVNESLSLALTASLSPSTSVEFSNALSLSLAEGFTISTSVILSDNIDLVSGADLSLQAISELQETLTFPGSADLTLDVYKEYVENLSFPLTGSFSLTNLLEAAEVISLEDTAVLSLLVHTERNLTIELDAESEFNMSVYGSINEFITISGTPELSASMSFLWEEEGDGSLSWTEEASGSSTWTEESSASTDYTEE